jgi:Asp-tRNA(Asn)/Glu-tRNA(Gln) amidotransferase C subunit
MSEEEMDEIEERLKKIRARVEQVVALDVEDVDEDERIQQTRKKIDRLRKRV